jgi:ABC-type sugar transport system ATPase subunit
MSSPTEPDPAAVLDARGVAKRWGHTAALVNGSLSVASGEIHALLGQNGAGKSTLIKILAGVVQRDGGDLSVAGEDLPQTLHPKDVRQLGISFIHQDLGLVEDMTIAENIALGTGFPATAGVISRRKLAELARAHLDALAVRLEIERPVGELDGAEQALVAIARAVVDGGRLIVLDEPTARLRGAEVERLFGELRSLRQTGVSFLYVTHRLGEVFELADRVTVFRDGETVVTADVADLSEQELIRHIVGRSVDNVFPTEHHGVVQGAKCVLQISSLRTHSVHDFDLELMEGEIFGLTGVVGSGAAAVGRALFGADEIEDGRLQIDGEAVPWETRAVLGRGVAYVPGDRHRYGLAIDLPIRENLVLVDYVSRGISGALSWLKWFTPISVRAEEATAERLVDEFAIRAASVDEPVGTLSGGNQQKVLLGRWMHLNPRLLVLEDPTQGVDVGTRAEIYAAIAALADRGSSILLISSDFEEVAELCDRVVVMRDGIAAAELRAPELSEAAIATESYRVSERRPG